MKELIILANNINETEFLRTLAKLGLNTFNIRVMDSKKLATHILVSNGINPECATKKEQVLEYLYILKNINSDYFKTVTYKDAENVSNSIDKSRLLEDTSFDGEFKDKDEALKEVFDKYNLRDKISLIEEAINYDIEADIYVMDEFELYPLELRLAGNCTKTNIVDFCHAERKDISVKKLFKAYGTNNEIEAVFSEIIKNDIAIDKCLIAVTDTKIYSQLISDFCQSHNINVTFGCGLPASYSHAVTLLKKIYKWNTDGLNGIDATRKMLNIDEDLVKQIGNLRINFNKYENKKKIDELKKYQVDASDIERITSIIEQGPASIIEHFCPNCETKQVVIDMISDLSEAYDNIDELMDAVLIECESLVKDRTISAPGAIHVVGIEDILPSLRENVFIIGMSSNMFPGNAREDSLIYDDDIYYEKYKSMNRLKDKTSRFNNTLKVLCSFGSNIYISYPYFDTVNVAELTCASCVLDLNLIEEEVESFSFKLNTTDNFYRAYIDNIKSKSNIPDKKEKNIKLNSARVYSPTKITTYIDCQLKFFYDNILKLDIKDKDNPFSIVDPLDLGSIVHTCMEKLAKYKLSEHDFIEMAETFFNKQLAIRPPINKKKAKIEKEQFIDMLSTAYKSEVNEVLGAETSEEKATSTGITVRGRVDRIERDKDGKIIVADFKSGSKVVQAEGDTLSCMQTLLYAFMIKQYVIDNTEFRYLKLNRNVTCDYNKQREDEILELLSKLSDSLNNTAYEKNEKDCTNCPYKEICSIDIE